MPSPSSWDAADDDTYLRIRGVRGFAAVRAGVQALDGHHAHARVTVWRQNVAQLDSILESARETGFTESSLLAADTTSAGFGERGIERGELPTSDQLPALRAFLDRADPFVVMSAYARERLMLLCSGGTAPARCIAPWTSGVVDPTGRWRHCFFLDSDATVESGLRAAMRRARPARRGLDVDRNEVCARCVCWRG